MTTRNAILEIEIRIKPPQRARRWKVQRGQDIFARDRSDRRFVFAKVWHTVKELDRLASAERVLGFVRREDPDHDYRLAEEWPIGSEIKGRP
jgi:hypothetical protein